MISTVAPIVLLHMLVQEVLMPVTYCDCNSKHLY